MDPSILVVLLVGGITTVLATAAAVSARGTRRRAGTWRDYAAARGFRLVEGPSGKRSPDMPKIEGRSSQAMVRLDTFMVDQGRSTLLYTRAQARFASGGGPSFEVYKEGVLSTVGKALGAQDVVLGGPTLVDDNFDQQLMVKCDDAEGTRLVWTTRAKALMVAELSDARVASDGEIVTVVLLGAVVEAAKLDALLELAGELASFGARDLAVLATLPNATFVEASGRWGALSPPKLAVETPRGEVIASVLARHGRPRLQLAIAHGRAIAPFSTDVRNGVAPGVARGLVPEGASALLGPIGEASLVGDDKRLRLTWSSVPPAEIVKAGVDLLAALADPKRSMGAFR